MESKEIKYITYYSEHPAYILKMPVIVKCWFYGGQDIYAIPLEVIHGFDFGMSAHIHDKQGKIRIPDNGYRVFDTKEKAMDWKTEAFHECIRILKKEISLIESKITKK